MADEKDTLTPEVIESAAETKAEKNAEGKTESIGGESKGIGAWFAGIRSEYRKIIWPNRKELSTNTITVIITSAVIALCVAVMDQVFSLGYHQLLQFASRFVE